MNRIAALIAQLFVVALLLSGCATWSIKPEDCPAGTQQLEDCPPVGAMPDALVKNVRAGRSFDRDDLPDDFDLSLIHI